jgi:sarcosine oxidase subunit beta
MTTLDPTRPDSDRSRHDASAPHFVRGSRPARDQLPEHPDVLWRNPEPKRSYDVVIVGAGGHGLATAHYLAKNHGIRDVAVLERSWLGGGNMSRNTTIIRSNYLWDESSAIYEHSLKLWETLEDDLGYSILFDQRGVLNLAHSLQDVRDGVRRVEANRLNGIDAEWLTPDEVKKDCPIVNTSQELRYPVLGATYQPRAGIARHDYVAWGFARRADEAGVDIIQDCAVTGFQTQGDRVTGVRTTRGDIAAGTVVLCAAGTTTVLTDMLGLRIPVQSHPLQALVSEILEPVHPTVVMSNYVHVYVSQAHKGELVMGAGVDSYNGYGQRGAFHVIERQMAAAVELFPVFARAHLLRSWAGIVDVCPDASPIVGKTPYEGLYLNCGWGTGGFKGTPGLGWCLADTIANDEPHPYIAPFGLDRFVTSALIDEHGAAGVAH